MPDQLSRDALAYHRLPVPGKLAISATKPLASQHDLSLAYSPGVAAACDAIAADPAEASNLTARSNLVAVVTNGTAVLGLGAIGPLAAKPVMEGKAVLFKKFSGIDVFDVEIDEQDPERFCDVVASLEPTFGGINLEDVKAPECFEIESRLRERMRIPVFHDDQHGTAIIVGAAVRNALELVGKSIGDVRLVASGAGAAALACLDLLLDPACGSGNFLYLALHALKDVEHRVQLEAEAMGFQRAFPAVGPANVRGVELNAYAAELARVSVWVGEIQWMRRNGFRESRDPILKPLDTIECRDALLAPGGGGGGEPEGRESEGGESEGAESEWPAADVVIGNPPFLGGKLLNAHLGEDYVSRLFTVYEGRVPAEADLVCYWFVKAGEQMRAGRAKRVGLVSTNSIRGGANRRALQAAIRECPIFEAWSDEPWVVDGAAVRVSLVCFARQGPEDVPKQEGVPRQEGVPKQRGATGPEGTPGSERRLGHSAAGGSADSAGRQEEARWPEDTPGPEGTPGSERRLDGQPVDAIHADLTARRGGAGVDLTGAQRLYRNMGVAFMGDTKGGPFDVRGEQARDWLRAPVALAPVFRAAADATASDHEVDAALATTGADAAARLATREALNRLGYVWCPPGQLSPVTWSAGIPSLMAHVLDHAKPPAPERAHP